MRSAAINAKIERNSRKPIRRMTRRNASNENGKIRNSRISSANSANGRNSKIKSANANRIRNVQARSSASAKKTSASKINEPNRTASNAKIKTGNARISSRLSSADPNRNGSVNRIQNVHARSSASAKKTSAVRNPNAGKIKTAATGSLKMIAPIAIETTRIRSARKAAMTSAGCRSDGGTIIAKGSRRINAMPNNANENCSASCETINIAISSSIWNA